MIYFILFIYFERKTRKCIILLILFRVYPPYIWHSCASRPTSLSTGLEGLRAVCQPGTHLQARPFTHIILSIYRPILRFQVLQNSCGSCEDQQRLAGLPGRTSAFDLETKTKKQQLLLSMAAELSPDSMSPWQQAYCGEAGGFENKNKHGWPVGLSHVAP